MKKVEFEGDPKIVILGTESTKVGSQNSINPCIKATLGQTFEIFGGSGKGCFFGRFPIGEKWAKGSMDVSLGAARGGKTAPEDPAATRRRGPFWLAGP